MFKHMVFFWVDLLDSPRDGESVAGDVLVGHEIQHHGLLLVRDRDKVNKAPERRPCDMIDINFLLYLVSIGREPSRHEKNVKIFLCFNFSRNVFTTVIRKENYPTKLIDISNFLAPARSPVSYFVVSLYVCMFVFKHELWLFPALSLAMNVSWMCHDVSWCVIWMANNANNANKGK